MSLASEIPVTLRILRYPCRVFYKGQLRPCSICRSGEHRAVDCPLRDVCRRCRQPGHFERNCDRLVPVPVIPVAPASSGEADDEDDDEDVDVDDDEVDDDDDDALASGDEEVLRSAPPLSDSPRRLRSSTRLSDVPVPAPSPAPVVPVPPPASVPALSPAPVPVVPAPPPASVPAPSPTPVVPAPPPAPAPVPAPSPASVPVVPAPSVPAPSSVPPPSPALVPAPSSVPMDFTVPSFSDYPRWIARAPEWITALLSNRPHSSDTHILMETYDYGLVRGAIDFGRNTYRILKESRNPDVDRADAYLTRLVVCPSVSSFGIAATTLPPLSADVVPARFPVRVSRRS